MSVDDKHPILRAESLTCRRGDRLVAAPLDFAMYAGDILEIGGPNGCGKTTLLRSISGLVPVGQGSLLWRGEVLQGNQASFREELSYIGHADGIKAELSVIENIGLANALLGARGDPLRALERLGLAAIRGRMTRFLSAGQRRRLALARLVLAETPLWLLDEPFTALDRDGIKLVASLIEEHAAAGGLAIYTSHHPVSVSGARRLTLEPMAVITH